MFLCQPFADYCCAFHVFPTVGSISHTRSRYQGTDERLPAVGRARAGGACVASRGYSLVSFLSSVICYLYISGPSEDGAGLTSVLCASPCLIISRAAESVLCVCACPPACFVVFMTKKNSLDFRPQEVESPPPLSVGMDVLQLH